MRRRGVQPAREDPTTRRPNSGRSERLHRRMQSRRNRAWSSARARSNSEVIRTWRQVMTSEEYKSGSKDLGGDGRFVAHGVSESQESHISSFKRQALSGLEGNIVEHYRDGEGQQDEPRTQHEGQPEGASPVRRKQRKNQSRHHSEKASDRRCVNRRLGQIQIASMIRRWSAARDVEGVQKYDGRKGESE